MKILTLEFYVYLISQYREANATRRCGILPAVHRNEYGYERERVAFGEYPWQVAILDSYQTYLGAGAIISPRHVITSAKALKGKDDYDLRVRIGEYDLESDHNYLEVYKNYEISVCKRHSYYSGGLPHHSLTPDTPSVF